MALRATRLRRLPRRPGDRAAIVVLVIGQIALGALVAGLKAGLVYDTWPLIDGALVPARERLFLARGGSTSSTIT